MHTTAANPRRNDVDRGDELRSGGSRSKGALCLETRAVLSKECGHLGTGVTAVQEEREARFLGNGELGLKAPPLLLGRAEPEAIQVQTQLTQSHHPAPRAPGDSQAPEGRHVGRHPRGDRLARRLAVGPALGEFEAPGGVDPDRGNEPHRARVARILRQKALRLRRLFEAPRGHNHGLHALPPNAPGLGESKHQLYRIVSRLLVAKMGGPAKDLLRGSFQDKGQIRFVPLLPVIFPEEHGVE